MGQKYFAVNSLCNFFLLLWGVCGNDLGLIGAGTCEFCEQYVLALIQIKEPRLLEWQAMLDCLVSVFCLSTNCTSTALYFIFKLHFKLAPSSWPPPVKPSTVLFFLYWEIFHCNFDLACNRRDEGSFCFEVVENLDHARISWHCQIAIDQRRKDWMPAKIDLRSWLCRRSQHHKGRTSLSEMVGDKATWSQFHPCGRSQLL